MSYSLYFPETAEEAVRLQQATCGAYLAGGTVTLVNHHRGKNVNLHQISLERIKSLHEISCRDGILSIGSMVTMDELEMSTAVRENVFALWQAAIDVGGPQIRNRATIGGNIAAASPSSDCVTPLMALNARIIVFGLQGRHQIALRDLYTGYLQTLLKPDELIISVDIPIVPGQISAFRKVGKRNALAVSCINMAVVRTGKEIAVSVGAAAPTVVYCEETSELLSADAGSADAWDRILTEISPIDDRWATASYRKKVCRNLLQALLKETEADR